MKQLQTTKVYMLDYREIDDMIDEAVGIPSYPGYDWKLWDFVTSQMLRNDTCLKIDLTDEDDFDEFQFMEVIEWCQRMHKANAYLEEHKADIEAKKNFKHGDGTYTEEYQVLSDKVDELMNYLKLIGVNDRPEDYMGVSLLHALKFAQIIPPGIYVIEASW